MKKIKAIALIVALALVMTACKKTQTNKSEEINLKDASPLEITEATLTLATDPDDEGDAFINFVGKIHNPNSFGLEFPKFGVTLKDPDGSIIATGEQVGMDIAPDDVVTLIGMIDVRLTDISEDTDVHYTIDCSGICKNSENMIRTSDFLVENVSEREGDTSRITGEVTNTTDKEIDMANVSMLLRKDGNIVYAENTFVDDLHPGKAVAFQFESWHGWPEHDDIEMSVQEW